MKRGARCVKRKELYFENRHTFTYIFIVEKMRVQTEEWRRFIPGVGCTKERKLSSTMEKFYIVGITIRVNHRLLC